MDVWWISHSKVLHGVDQLNPQQSSQVLCRRRPGCDRSTHIAHNADGDVVDQFLDCRYNDRMAAFEVEVCVRWRGLQAIEDSWEPAANLLEDISTEFKRYMRSNKADPQVKAMAAALGVTQSLGGIVANFPFVEPLNPSQEGIQVFD
ncbi:hypothetical protein H257_17867 [Aphanomyces astaci]|uniref:Chromo domain-containing protein n=1 Tax=Aphanomyces astaci TaxID=112090 RepID=W4FEZ8_APHAT|nr:hypothetical protein H257_17867 [Aphanomyces astaci]ETV65406.1 hypothetical protein H257_17867 [Aphanomyces astaci]|eukprot:XP_009845121.1 hypothetical protein H257_17867 [Aphanomyces astaci]